MATWRSVPQNLENIASSNARMASEASMQTDLLRGIGFTTAVNAAATIVMAHNQNAAHQEQMQMEHEKLRLQMEENERRASHDYVMWRDSTAAGKAYDEWRERAIGLIDYLQYRNIIWANAWQEVVNRACAQVSVSERATYLESPEKIENFSLKSTWVIVLVLFVLATISGMGILLANILFLPFALILELTGNRTSPLATTLGDAVAIFSIYIVPLIVVLLVFSKKRKANREAAEYNKNLSKRQSEESQKRINKWGFDPLDAPLGYIGFGWAKYSGLTEYRNRVEHLINHGATLRPKESELIDLLIPESLSPSDDYYEPINNALNLFLKDIEELNDA